MRVSIIIPMYRVEKYIEKCIKSCISQNNITLGDDYEIICVDDGSPDKSASIAESFEKRYNGLRVVHQENQGLSGARNTGMSFAQGEYVWFVDSDDWIEPDALKNIFPYLKDSLDLLEIQYQNVYEDGRIENGDSGCGIYNVVSGRSATLCGGVHTPAQFSIFRTEFLKNKNLLFERGIFHEDVDFKVRALLLAEKVTSTPAVCYDYLQRTSGSITSTFKLKNGTDMLYVLKRHYNFVQSYDNEIKKAVYRKISMWMNSVLLGIHQLKGEEYDILFNKLKNSKDLYYAMRHSNNLKYILEGVVLSMNLSLGLWLYSRLK